MLMPIKVKGKAGVAAANANDKIHVLLSYVRTYV